MNQIMTFKMELDRMPGIGQRVQIARDGRSDRLRATAKLTGMATLAELGLIEEAVSKLFRAGKLQGEWLVSVAGWEVVGEPDAAIERGKIKVTCKIALADPRICFATHAGEEEAARKCTTEAARRDAIEEYRRLAEAGRDLLAQLVEQAEHPDTEWSIQSLPEQSTLSGI